MKGKCFLFFCLMAFNVAAQNTDESKMKKLIDENFQFAASQYKFLSQKLPADKMPKTFEKGELKTSGVEWWTSGFYPGSLWLIYEHTGDAAIKAEAEKKLAIEEKIKRYTGNHDIGFMIFCSFGNAYRITGDAKYKEVIDTAAAYQITRYRPSIKAIQSWNKSDKFNCPVIIDNMMNLEQLCWVTENGGEKKYKDIAITHANTTLKNHFRKDNSSYHVVDYDINTGKVLKKVTHQGLADSSAWARGQAWGLYGYTMMYRFTKKKKYLKQAEAIAKFMIHHPNMPDDMVPYWDYDAAPGATTKRDASAAAITSSALLELSRYSKKNQQEYKAVAEKQIQSLSSEVYKSKAGENGGFILNHSVGFLLGNSEVDVPLTYADYYFLEAMKRYGDWYLR